MEDEDKERSMRIVIIKKGANEGWKHESAPTCGVYKLTIKEDGSFRRI